MVEYFSRIEQESGIELLKKATNLGHEVAAYMLGLILLCTNYPLKDQALEILQKVEQGCSPSSSAKIKKCRNRLKEILKHMWTSTVSVPKPAEPIIPHSLVCNKRNGLINSSGWLSIEDEEPPNCEACKWDREIVLLRNVLHATS
ncbi:uncharacterized protein LOC122665566 [Telopea speciosissima]|uniref:uncharacterized protein LOC122665566 n=1 Tax=Telopea speciosissima TaxID=54955 RepID=UPI001CC7A03E|nr:uncharacterized protein LOC122665566 [Telopea speciosissima]